MLTSLEIANFKGVARRQRVEFSPLTLLFGANSAGKSTILQALLYLHELIERGGADVDRTELGGDVIELGGFARLVHRHETKRSIVLRVEFATAGSLERFGRELADFPFPDLDDEIESAWIELTIRQRTTPTFRGPIVDRAVIGVNGDRTPLIRLETGSTLREGEPLMAHVDLAHKALFAATGPALSTEARVEALVDVASAWRDIAFDDDEPLDEADESDTRRRAMKRSFPIARSAASALPPLGAPLRVISPEDLDDDRAALATLHQTSSADGDRAKIEDLKASIDVRERALGQVRTFLEMIVMGTTMQLASFLRDALYVGPLRDIPPRGFLYERAGRATSWANGLAAWDLLLADRLTLVERTNAWLKRLGAGCQVVVQQLFHVGTDAEDMTSVDRTVRRLLLDTGSPSLVLPSEVGAGISQIMPVIVAAIEGRFGLTMIEQPEIHVHPAVQVGLGDLLIDAVTRDGSRRMMLVETHSEHLILRLLRRIRETTENELAAGDPPFSKDKLSVLHVESSLDGVHIKRLRVDEHGEFVDRWPRGFFDERARELF